MHVNFIYASILGDSNISCRGKSFRFLFSQSVKTETLKKINYVIEMLNAIPKTLKTPASFTFAKAKKKPWAAVISF